MVGITLSPEQIKDAPPEVRRWLERQVTTSLGFVRPETDFQTPDGQMPRHHLMACGLEEAQGILSLIYGMLPVVSVFFELAREPVAIAASGIHVLRLDDMMRHARLETMEQVVACLAAIDRAFQRVTGQSEATLTAVDDQGHCLVADATAASIFALWREVIAARSLGGKRDEMARDSLSNVAAQPVSPAPYTLSMPQFTTMGQPATALRREGAVRGIDGA